MQTLQISSRTEWGAEMDLSAYCRGLAQRARSAARALATVMGERKNRWLQRAADALERRTDEIVHANCQDVAAAAEQGMASALVDRLRLTPERLLSASA